MTKIGCNHTEKPLSRTTFTPLTHAQMQTLEQRRRERGKKRERGSHDQVLD